MNPGQGRNLTDSHIGPSKSQIRRVKIEEQPFSVCKQDCTNSKLVCRNPGDCICPWHNSVCKCPESCSATYSNSDHARSRKFCFPSWARRRQSGLHVSANEHRRNCLDR